MLNEIKKTLENYYLVNNEVMEIDEKAKIKAEIAYISEFSANENIKAQEENEKLKRIIFKLLSRKDTNDIKVSRTEFLDIYNLALADLGSDNCELYGNDVEVHWHGIYCNCGDGATAYNNIIGGIDGVIMEQGDEE